jgi:sugar phosphate isomerase/epimerase
VGYNAAAVLHLTRLSYPNRSSIQIHLLIPDKAFPMFHRRQFLATTLAASSSLVLSRSGLSALPPDHAYMKTLGLQLWTVRNQMASDPQATLKTVAAAGYKQVELMDVADAKQIAPIAKDLGMEVNSAFFNWEVLGNDKPTSSLPSMDQIIEQAKQYHLKYLVFGYIGKGHRETVAQYQRIAERCNQAAEKCHAAGLTLCYHNHSFEFAAIQDKTTGFDVFMKEFEPKNMKFELDVFWVAIGGWDPLDTLKRLKGRVAQVHLKDLLTGSQTETDEGKVPAEAFKEVGEGCIDMKQVIQIAEDIGVELCHVEQDQSPAPLKSIELSVQNLKKL